MDNYRKKQNEEFMESVRYNNQMKTLFDMPTVVKQFENENKVCFNITKKEGLFTIKITSSSKDIVFIKEQTTEYIIKFITDFTIIMPNININFEK